MTHADTIITADTIVTMDRDNPIAQALAISNGKLTAVGEREAVLAHAGANTEIVALGDACVLPGLIEPHTHPDLLSAVRS